MYILTITDRQAQVLSKACEILARLGMGQFRDALEEIPFLDEKGKTWREDLDIVEMILSRHSSKENFSVKETHNIAWDLYQVLRHRVSWDRAIEDKIIESVDSPRKWKDMWGVHYDDPLKTSIETLAKIEKVIKKR